MFVHPYTVDGGFAEWSEFGPCDKSCGGGKKTRIRTCDNPLPKYGGDNCASLGEAVESSECNTHGCPGNSTNPVRGSFLNNGLASLIKIT